MVLGVRFQGLGGYLWVDESKRFREGIGSGSMPALRLGRLSLNPSSRHLESSTLPLKRQQVDGARTLRDKYLMIGAWPFF